MLHAALLVALTLAFAPPAAASESPRTLLAAESLLTQPDPIAPGEERYGTDGTWTRFDLDRLRRRAGHVSIYDSLRDRVIVFGGYDRSNIPNDETWALSLSDSPSWSRLAASGPRPPARNFHSGIYDPLRDRIVIFGGYDGTHRNDVWSLSLAADDAGWTLIQPSGTPPAGRWGNVAVYDPTRDRMVIMGGHNGNQVDANDVWELSFAGTPTWTALSPTGVLPAPRNLHAGIYDAPRDRLIIFGGETNWTPRGDLWSLDFSSGLSWTALTSQGMTPTARDGCVMVHHPDTDRLVLFGGYDGAYVADAYELALTGDPEWSALSPSGAIPTGRRTSAGVLDTQRGRLIVVAGNEGSQRTADVWVLELDEDPAWAEIQPSPVWPVGRWGHAMVHDPSRNRFLVVGGSVGVENGGTDVWEFALGSGLPWRRLIPQGTPPGGLSQHSAIYDPVSDRVIVFGGYDGDDNNRTWSLSLKGTPQWSQLATTGPVPLRRRGHLAVYRESGNSMIVFGGYNGTYLSDVWSLSLTGTPMWTALTQQGSQPAARQGAAGIFDPRRERLIIFGGSGTDAFFNDVWSLGLGTGTSWVQLEQSGASPSRRVGPSAVYDETEDRMVVFGGLNALVPGTNDVWALSLTGSPSWSELLPAGTKPLRRYYHSAGLDPVGNRMMIFGGYNDAQRDDVWFLTWNAERQAPVDVPVSFDGRVADGGIIAYPNPSNASVQILFRVSTDRSSSLGIYDASGRRIRSLVSGSMPAGVQATTWDRLDDNGHAVAPGTYFLRLTSSNGEQMTERVTIVR